MSSNFVYTGKIERHMDVNRCSCFRSVLSFSGVVSQIFDRRRASVTVKIDGSNRCDDCPRPAGWLVGLDDVPGNNTAPFAPGSLTNGSLRLDLDIEGDLALGLEPHMLVLNA